MKKTAPLASLLLAGALLTATLAGCTDADTPSNADQSSSQTTQTTDLQSAATTSTTPSVTSDTKPNDERPSVSYDSPEDAYAKLLTIESGNIDVQFQNDEITTQYYANKEGNLVMLSKAEIDMTGDRAELVTDVEIYYDLEAKLRYIKEDEKWRSEAYTESLDWQDIVETVIKFDGDYWYDTVLVDDNYEVREGRYWMKPEVISAFYQLPYKQMNGRAYMQDDTTYVIDLIAFDDNDLCATYSSLTMRYSKYEAVELPEVSEDEPPLTEPTPIEPTPTPSEIYAAIFDAQNVYLSTKRSSSQNNAGEILTDYLQKDGDKVALHNIKLLFEGDAVTDRQETVTYFDLTEGLSYYEDGDGWHTESESIKWSDLVDRLFSTVGDDAIEILFSDDSYTPDEEGDYAMKADALASLYGDREGFETSGSILHALNGEFYWFHTACGNGDVRESIELDVGLDEQTVELPEIE